MNSNHYYNNFTTYTALVGAVLHQHRIKRGFSELSVATALHIPLHRVRRYEKGTLDIPVGLLLPWTSTLDLTVSELFAIVDLLTIALQQVEHFVLVTRGESALGHRLSPEELAAALNNISRIEG